MSLYTTVVDIARDYMGPAAETFIKRQITAHLELSPEALAPQHLEELGRWCLISGNLILDAEKAREFCERIQKLQGQSFS